MPNSEDAECLSMLQMIEEQISMVKTTQNHFQNYGTNQSCSHNFNIEVCEVETMDIHGEDFTPTMMEGMCQRTPTFIWYCSLIVQMQLLREK